MSDKYVYKSDNKTVKIYERKKQLKHPAQPDGVTDQ